MKRALSFIALILTTAIAGIVVAPGAAYAGQDAIVDSLGGGAQSQFRNVGEHLFACDTKSDGLRASAIAQWTGVDGVFHSAETQDADGANNNCAGHANLSVAEGIRITIFACTRNGATGALRDCNSIIGIA